MRFRLSKSSDQTKKGIGVSVGAGEFVGVAVWLGEGEGVKVCMVVIVGAAVFVSARGGVNFGDNGVTEAIGFRPSGVGVDRQEAMNTVKVNSTMMERFISAY
jgi:hypothetical protein